MPTALLIFLGGGLGAMSRWFLSSQIEQIALKTTLKHFPWGIVTCNLIGCLLVGILFGSFSGTFSQREHPTWLFPLAVTGFLGGFTTFSAFGNDTRQLFIQGFNALAITNVLVSTIGGIALVFVGFKLAASLTA